jgi:hypothetical protein
MSRLKSLSHCAAPGHQPAFPRHAQMRHRPTVPPQHIQRQAKSHKQQRAYLAEQKVWLIVSGKDTRSSDATQAVVWRDKAAATAGAIYRALELGQRVHVAGVEMDPVKMWEKLAAVHVQKVSDARFNALDALLAVRKSPDKFLPSVVA